jgi:hypothetical protein
MAHETAGSLDKAQFKSQFAIETHYHLPCETLHRKQLLTKQPPAKGTPIHIQTHATAFAILREKEIISHHYLAGENPKISRLIPEDRQWLVI